MSKDWRSYQDENIMGQIFTNQTAWIIGLCILVLGFCVLGVYL